MLARDTNIFAKPQRKGQIILNLKLLVFNKKTEITFCKNMMSQIILQKPHNYKKV